MLPVPSPFLSPTPLPPSIVFEEGLPFEATCPKCEQALRAPVRTPCDHYYCKSCIDVENGSTSCMVCQAIIPKGGVTADKAKHRQIQSLPVKCTFFDNGCEWKGQLKQLQSHLNECPMRDSICPNCQRSFAEKALQSHLAQCQSETTVCEYCSQKVRTERIARHMNTCPMVPISCPFQCGLVDAPRQQVEDHRPMCPNAENICPFVNMGCNFAGDKVSVQGHLSDEPVRHLVFCCDEVALQKQAYDLLISDLESLFTRSKELTRKVEICEEMYGPQLIWRIDNVFTKMNEAKSGARPTVFSPPFMSGRHGYKLIASASMFGDGANRGQNMSVYVALVKGEFDTILEWPFRRVVKLTLLDQKPRPEDRIDIVYSVDSRTLTDHAHFLARPTSERNASFGAQAFCSLRKMEEYVKDDTLFIRIDIDIPSEWEEPFELKEGENEIDEEEEETRGGRVAVAGEAPRGHIAVETVAETDASAAAEPVTV